MIIGMKKEKNKKKIVKQFSFIVLEDTIIIYFSFQSKEKGIRIKKLIKTFVVIS